MIATADHLPRLPLVVDRIPLGLRRVLEQEGLAYVEQSAGAARGRFVLYDSQQGRARLGDAQIGLDARELCAEFPFDPFDALLDEQSASWSWKLGELEPREELARVDHRSVRLRLAASLRRMLERAGGVWMKLAAFPFPYRSAFNLRIDHDDYDAHDFARLCQATEGFESSLSHYVNAAGHRQHQSALARLRGQHVGSHGYWHHTYRLACENLNNARRGIDALRGWGLDPVGFVAPHGRFNRGLLAALAHAGVSHSSEFGLAWDDLPFFPYEGRVLQIPVHPCCLGIGLEAAERQWPRDDAARHRALDAVVAHFVQFANCRHALGEPVFLYGHPSGRLGRYPRVVREVLATVAAWSDMWRVSLAEFESWWRARGQARLRVDESAHTLRVHVEGASSRYRLGLEIWRGEEVATVPLDGSRVEIPTASLSWQPRRVPAASYTAPRRMDHRLTLRAGVKRFLDWEKVTPVEEINVAHWRGWLKRAMRRIST